MYEQYYGFTERPFSLTPDPKFLFRSETHAGAFELLEYAMRRRDGFVVITGDIGTGKTTLCRALLGRLDRQTFSALLLNPFLSETDLLKLILRDFGVVPGSAFKHGHRSQVSKQALIDTLNDFLLSLLPLGACAMLIVDEAQNLPSRVLEQIRILSNLETNKEKLLQIVLVGQPALSTTLRTPELRQLAQRVSITYELRPLTPDEVTAYIIHRLNMAGGGSSVIFRPRGARGGLSTVAGDSTGDQPVMRPRPADRVRSPHHCHRRRHGEHVVRESRAGAVHAVHANVQNPPATPCRRGRRGARAVGPDWRHGRRGVGVSCVTRLPSDRD